MCNHTQHAGPLPDHILLLLLLYVPESPLAMQFAAVVTYQDAGFTGAALYSTFSRRTYQQLLSCHC